MTTKLKNIYSEEERIKLIKKEKRRLIRIFKKFDDDRLQVAEKMIDDAAFLRTSLDEAQELIKRDGIVEEYQNGANQHGIKKSAAVEVYDKLTNTYIKVVNLLCNQIPENMMDDEVVGLCQDVQKYKR